jgi:hypothetical protein
MKIILIAFLLTITLSVKAQIATNEPVFASVQKIELNLNKVDYSKVKLVPHVNYGNPGPGLMIAGGAFTVLGLLTSPEWYGLHGEDKKFFENPARAAAVLGGIVILGAGIIVSINR